MKNQVLFSLKKTKKNKKKTMKIYLRLSSAAIVTGALRVKSNIHFKGVSFQVKQTRNSRKCFHFVEMAAKHGAVQYPYTFDSRLNHVRKLYV